MVFLLKQVTCRRIRTTDGECIYPEQRAWKPRKTLLLTLVFVLRGKLSFIVCFLYIGALHLSVLRMCPVSIWSDFYEVSAKRFSEGWKSRNPCMGMLWNFTVLWAPCWIWRKSSNFFLIVLKGLSLQKVYQYPFVRVFSTEPRNASHSPQTKKFRADNSSVRPDTMSSPAMPNWRTMEHCAIESKRRIDIYLQCVLLEPLDNSWIMTCI